MWQYSSANFKKIKILLFVCLFGLFIYAIFQLRIDNTSLRWKNNTLEYKSQLLIDTPGCKILNYEPMPASLHKYFKKETVSCSENEDHQITSSRMNILSFYPENISSKYLNSTNRNQLRELRRGKKIKNGNEFLSLRNILKRENVSCCYKTIERIKPSSKSKRNFDKSYDLKLMLSGAILEIHSYLQNKKKKNDDFQFSPNHLTAIDNLDPRLSKECYEIRSFETVINYYDAVAVYCSSSNESNFYADVQFLVQDKREDSMSTRTTNKDKLNVIIFGTDSVSRLNFLRFNNKTYNYLTKELNAFEFKGYNKVGDNTIPNVMALLTGQLMSDDISKKCSNDLKGPFDDCHFIWKDFREMGYITTLMEDSPLYATFNYNRRGFVNPPTDHYPRPGFLAADKILKKKSKDCIGGKLVYKVLHSYSHDFQVTYQSELTFSFLWATTLTHNVLTQTSSVDEPHLQYLKSLKEDGLLNNTILFFISDHGIRFGKFRETYLGKYEENLPYLFIVVPEWFPQKYPMATKHLRENGKKWLTPLDVYETLQDILHDKYSDISYLTGKPPEKNRRISLFKNLPVDRNCNDIGMPINYCACQNYVPIEKDKQEIFEKIATHLKKHINNILRSYPKCAQITTLEVKKVLMDSEEKKVKVINVQASYNPGGAVIEATILWDKTKQNDDQFQVSEQISRLNFYGKQSHCVNDLQMVKICICKDRI